jgi:hypothetical protein
MDFFDEEVESFLGLARHGEFSGLVHQADRLRSLDRFDQRLFCFRGVVIGDQGEQGVEPLRLGLR